MGLGDRRRAAGVTVVVAHVDLVKLAGDELTKVCWQAARVPCGRCVGKLVLTRSARTPVGHIPSASGIGVKALRSGLRGPAGTGAYRSLGGGGNL